MALSQETAPQAGPGADQSDEVGRVHGAPAVRAGAGPSRIRPRLSDSSGMIDAGCYGTIVTGPADPTEIGGSAVLEAMSIGVITLEPVLTT